MTEKDGQVKAQMKDKFLNETLPFYMYKFGTIVKENNGYLANGKVSCTYFYLLTLFIHEK